MPRGFAHLKVGLCPPGGALPTLRVGLCTLGGALPTWQVGLCPPSGALPTWQVGLCPPSGALPTFVGLCPLFMQIRLKDDFSLDPVGCG